MRSTLLNKTQDVSKLLLELCNVPDYQVNIVFTDDDEVVKLNHQYRKKREPTNVLSFPLKDGAEPAFKNLPIKELGDIVISVDRAVAETLMNRQTLYQRLTWLMTHGLLHLLGYDHERGTAAQAQQMEIREHEIFALLRQDFLSANGYPVEVETGGVSISGR